MAGVLVPVTSAEAATPADRKKEQRYLNQLKRLPNGAAPPARVKQPTVRLVRLNPKRAQRFYKLATLKYSSAFVQRKARSLANQLRRIVSNRLPRAQANRINNRITKIELRIVIPVPPPTPTPYPYQALRTRLPEMLG